MTTLFALLCVQAFALVLLWLLFRRQITRRGNLRLKFLLITFGLYIAVLLFVLLNPVYYFRRLHFSTSRLNLVPFRVLTEWKANPFNLFGNILLFMPLGFFCVLFHPEDRTARKLLRTVATSALLSLMIEIAQLWTGRVSDIDDVIFNTLGGFLGACLCLLEHRVGFDRTKPGRFLLPVLPENWKGHMRLQLYCNILAVSAISGILALNYAVTQPSYRTFTWNGQTLQLEARNVALQSAETGEALFEADADTEICPASTMKILASLTALDYVNPDDVLHIGREIYAAPLDCSRAGLEAGMDLTVRQLLEGALLPSGADAVFALGTYCGRLIAGDAGLKALEAMKCFAEAMNAKAAAIGARHTHVVNPDGYDADGQYTTARDILLITAEFLKNPVLTEICSLPEDLIVLSENKSLQLSNTNAMLHTDSAYYNRSVQGVKTGTTSKAGNCLVSVFTIRGKQYLCAVMGSTYDGKFRDTEALYQYCAETAL